MRSELSALNSSRPEVQAGYRHYGKSWVDHIREESSVQRPKRPDPEWQPSAESALVHKAIDNFGAKPERVLSPKLSSRIRAGYDQLMNKLTKLQQKLDRQSPQIVKKAAKELANIFQYIAEKARELTETQKDRLLQRCLAISRNYEIVLP